MKENPYRRHDSCAYCFRTCLTVRIRDVYGTNVTRYKMKKMEKTAVILCIQVIQQILDLGHILLNCEKGENIYNDINVLRMCKMYLLNLTNNNRWFTS